ERGATELERDRLAAVRDLPRLGEARLGNEGARSVLDELIVDLDDRPQRAVVPVCLQRIERHRLEGTGECERAAALRGGCPAAMALRSPDDTHRQRSTEAGQRCTASELRHEHSSHDSYGGQFSN